MDKLVNDRLMSPDNFRDYSKSLRELGLNQHNYVGMVTHDLINEYKGLPVPISDILNQLNTSLTDDEADDPESYETIIALFSNPYVTDYEELLEMTREPAINLRHRSIKYGLSVGVYTILHAIKRNMDISSLLERIENPGYVAERLDIYRRYFDLSEDTLADSVKLLLSRVHII